MNIHDRGPVVRVLAVLLAVVALTAWGCSKSVTAPVDLGASQDTHDVAPIEFAHVVTNNQLDASEHASPDSVALAVRDQSLVEAVLHNAEPRVIGTAASTFRGHPVVLALTRAAVSTIPSRVGPRAVMEFVVGDVTAYSYYCGTSTGRADECSAGTLGAIVTDGVRNYWLSNWHVFVNPRGAYGDAIDSPGRYDVGCGPSTLVGTVSRYVPVKFDGSYNTVDCAIARIATGLSVSRVQSAGSASYVPAGTTKAATIGLAVKKVGERTGLTYGKVTAINASLPVAYGSGGTANFRGVIIFSKMAEAGDSGSLICTQSGNNPVALLFAGSTTTSVGCPIDAVYSAIGAHVPF